MSLVWTKEPPAQPGWYFVRNDHECCVRFLENGVAGLLIYDDFDECLYVSETGFCFAGPIPQPTEPGEGKE